MSGSRLPTHPDPGMIHVSALVLATLVTAVPGPGTPVACLTPSHVTTTLQERDEALRALYRSGFDPTAGRSVMESHPTPDGRASTPTVLLLDDSFDEAGCFIERPPALQDRIRERPGVSSQELYEGKVAWYDEDGGRGTVEAFVEMLEAAAEGRSACR